MSNRFICCLIFSLNLTMIGEVFADDSLTGLHLGFGLNVVADEYTSNLDILGGGNEKWTFTGPVLIEQSGADLHASIIDDITSHASRESSDVNIYGDKKAINIHKTITSLTSSSESYVYKQKSIKGKTNKVGGELKMSYFHNFTDHIVLGIDLLGTLNQKAKKNIGIDKLNYASSESTGGAEYKISYDNKSVTYKDGKFTDESDVTGFFQTTNTGGITHIPTRTYTIESIDGPSVEIQKIITDNPGYTELNSSIDTSQYIQISNENGGDVTFEKNKFNSRAALVVGAQYKGWFAGVRGGVSYNQGKIHAKDVAGTSSEEVAFASPFVGVHLMKSVNMKNLENGHIYVTADVNIDKRQKLNLKGIKNFKQNSVNVSLGMTWQIN